MPNDIENGMLQGAEDDELTDAQRLDQHYAEDDAACERAEDAALFEND